MVVREVRTRLVSVTTAMLLAAVLVVSLTSGIQPASAMTVLPQVTFDIGPTSNGRRPLSQPLRVFVSGGTIQSVTGIARPLGITDPKRTVTVKGTIGVSRKSWISRSLLPARWYRIVVVAVAPNGSRITRTATTATANPALALKAKISPRNKAVVGVGMPVVLTLSQPVTSAAGRRAVQRALSVSTSKAIGSSGWAWISSRQVQFRPKKFWPAGTVVRIRAKLNGVNAGRGVWGTADASRVFTVGRSQITSVNARTHRFTIKRNGKLIRSGGVSLGKPGFTTRSGIKVIMSRNASVRMRSATLGITSGPDAYDIIAPYAMRLTNSGEFLHGAPWNSQIGVANVSHGCTNVSLGNARWIYRNSLIGDPVITTGTARKSSLTNGLGGGWNLTWRQWKARSAL